jgi:hypothetical protein
MTMGSIKILMYGFPLVPVLHIRSLVESQKTLFAACLALKKSEELFQIDGRAPYEQLKKPRRLTTAQSRSITSKMKREFEAVIKAATKAANKEIGMLFIKLSKDPGC